jgi:hypothetical protein
MTLRASSIAVLLGAVRANDVPGAGNAAPHRQVCAQWRGSTVRRHSGAKEKIAPAIRQWTLHDLRRSFASGLQRLGMAPHIVELALNHRTGTFSGVAGIYQRHRYAKEVRDAFELWSQHIEALTIKKLAAA